MPGSQLLKGLIDLIDSLLNKCRCIAQRTPGALRSPESIDDFEQVLQRCVRG